MPDPITQPPRYCPGRALPPYSYVPGLTPHPVSDERGHSFGLREPTPERLDANSWRENAAFLWAVDLFNCGYYWEAHEAWESLWHVAGRAGPTADYLKGLIKLAAAGVKLREGNAAGVTRHVGRSCELLAAAEGTTLFGIDVARLIAAARAIADGVENHMGDGRPSAERRLRVMVRLRDWNAA
jgi:hypothetical protein